MTPDEIKDAADRAEKHAGGRPSKYSDAYVAEVTSFMDQGYSLTAFAGEIGVARSTINVWMAEHPEFSEAVSRAQAKRARWWEDRLRHIAEKGGGPGAATAAVFGIKNAAPEDFRDKQEHEHSGKDGAPIIPVINVTIGGSGSSSSS